MHRWARPVPPVRHGRAPTTPTSCQGPGVVSCGRSRRAPPLIAIAQPRRSGRGPRRTRNLVVSGVRVGRCHPRWQSGSGNGPRAGADSQLELETTCLTGPRARCILLSPDGTCDDEFPPEASDARAVPRATDGGAPARQRDSIASRAAQARPQVGPYFDRPAPGCAAGVPPHGQGVRHDRRRPEVRPCERPTASCSSAGSRRARPSAV